MPPNILIIMTDQQRWDSLACNGNVFAQTPSLDRISAEGVRFENSFAPYPLCSPARATAWTGVLPHEHRVMSCLYGFENALREFYPDKPTIFELFRNAGYATAYYGKWHLGCADPGYFDHWHGYNSLGKGEEDNFPGKRGRGLGVFWLNGIIDGDYKADLETDRVIKHLKEQTNSDQPFFLVCGYYPPHVPPTAPKQFFRYYRGRGVPTPGYYAAVSAIDYNIGRILDTLEASGLEKNTILVFCSDHGDSHKYRGHAHKTTCYEEVIKIPLLVRWPNKIKAGQVVNEIMGLEDIMPTLLDLAGLEIPKHIHGRSFTRLLDNQALSWRESYYVQNLTTENIRQRCLRSKEWKLILSDWPIVVKDYAGDNFLFNLAQDPEEQTNLYFDGGSKNTVMQLASLLGQRARELEDQLGIELAEKALLEIAKRGST